MKPTEDIRSLPDDHLIDYMQSLTEREPWTDAISREFTAAETELRRRRDAKAATARPIRRLDPGAGGGGEGSGALFETADGRVIRAFRTGDSWPHDGDGEGVGLAEIVRSQLTGGPTLGRHAVSRAHSAGDLSSGGAWLPSPVAAAMNDALRNTAAVTAAGAEVIPVEAGRLTLVRLDRDPAAAWKAEGAAGTHSEAQFSAVHLLTRMLVCHVKLSLELALTAPNVEQILRSAISQEMAAKLDLAALSGTGTGAEPLGLLSDASVPEIEVAAAPTTYAVFVNAVARLRAQNVPDDSVHCITGSDVATALDAMLDSTNQPMRPPRPIAAMQDAGRWHTSNQIATDRSTSPAEGSAIMGDFATGLVIGLTGGMRLEASYDAADATGSAWTQGEVWIRAAMMADIAIVRPTRFVKLTRLFV